MVITALSITLFFAALGLMAALLVAVHDGVEAWLQRRSLRVGVRTMPGGGDGGYPLAQPTPRRVGRRPRPAPLPVIAKQAPAPEPGGMPAWYENAQRDIAQR